jgi:hypothetical protein
MFREWRTRTWLKLKTLVKRRQLDRDLDDEIAFHLAMREEKILAAKLESLWNPTRNRMARTTPPAAASATPLL